MNTITNFFSRIIREWDTLTLPQQQFLQEWFTILWNTFEQKKKMKLTEQAGWFTTSDGIRLLPQDADAQGNQPLYRVELFKLPYIKKLDTKYAPVVSTIALDQNVLGQTTRNVSPEIISWRLDLWLNPSGECPVRDGIQFVCIRDNQPLAQPTYELDFIDGRKLSAFEAYYIKSIFDDSIKKLR